MIDHTGHPHPSTPKARALCRANGGTGFIGKIGTEAPVAKKVDRPPALTEKRVPVAKVTGSKVVEHNVARKKTPAKKTTASTSSSSKPLTGQAAHDAVPKGLFKRGTLTESQAKALRTYETGWFSVINGYLRNHRADDPDYKDEAKIVAEIRSAMEGSKLEQPVHAWRGMFLARSVFGDSFDNDLSGFSWDDKGFGSTTTNESVVDSFNLVGKTTNPAKLGQDVKMRVLIPAGTKVLQTSSYTEGSKANGPQAEITLQDGMTWKVVKDHGFNAKGVRELEVEVNPIG
jgi:hypothetical protein